MIGITSVFIRFDLGWLCEPRLKQFPLGAGLLQSQLATIQKGEI